MSQTKFKQTKIGLIPDEWQHGIFQEILVHDIRHGLYKSKEFYGKGIKLLKMGIQYSNNKVGNQEMERVNLTPDEITRFQLNENDLVFSRTSMMTDGAGKCSIVVNLKEPVVFDGNLLSATVNKTIVHPQFYFYYFNSKFAKQKISEITTGTQSRNISASNLKKLPIIIPSIQEQKSIAKILSDLDLKIELNQKMNKTLEAIGRAIFRRWFVDFEFPDENGRPYRSSGGEMVYSEELGREIPKGWSMDNLDGLCTEITDGSHFSPKEDMEGTKRIATVKNMGLFDIDFQSCKRISDADYKKLVHNGCKPEKGDILLSKDGTMGITHIFNGQVNLVLLSSIAILRVNDKLCPYLYHYLKENQTQAELIENHSSGSALPRIVLKDLKRLLVLVPSIELLGKFDLFVKPIIESIFHNSKESKSLSDIRDSLLPKLMSGKIRVPIEARK